MFQHLKKQAFIKYYSTFGMLERLRWFGFLRILIRKVALKSGASKQGKAFLADSGSNWVAAKTLVTSRR